MLSIHVGGAVSNVVVRAEAPSSAGHGVAPVSVAPSATAGGLIPDFCNVVDVGTVVVVDDVDVELIEPRKAPRVESDDGYDSTRGDLRTPTSLPLSSGRCGLRLLAG